jgi:hypothetical protein
VNGILAAILVTAIVLVPLWSADIPPLLDYPNHLARQYIIFNLRHSELLQQFYRVEWTVVPYLAMDVIVRLLANFLAVDIASKVFLSIGLLSVAMAPLALNLALFNRVTPIALVGLLFVHNNTLSLGFVNYIFAAGFSICLFALWIGFRDGSPWKKFVLFPVLSTLLFFSHLLGSVLYGVVVGAYELGRYVEQVRKRPPSMPTLWASLPRLELSSLALQFAVPLAIYLILGPISSDVTYLTHNTYGGLRRKFELLAGLFFNLIQPYSWTLDRGLAIGLTVAAVLLPVTRKANVPRAMLWPLSALVLLVVAMPMELLSGWGADHRLLLPLGMLVAGSVNVKSWPGKSWSFVVAILAALVVTRVVVITIDWRKANAEYTEYQRAFDALTDGSTVYFAFGHAGEQKIWPRPEYHIPCLAVRTKQVYVPYLFQIAGMQYTPDYDRLQRLSRGPVLTHHESPDWRALMPAYDYFLLVNEHFFDTAVPKELIPVFQGGKVSVYKNPLRK